MANVLTNLGEIPIFCLPSALGNKTKVFKLSHDGSSGPETILTPATGNSIALCGMLYQEATAHNLTLYSGANIHVTLERVANDGLYLPLGKPAFATIAGEALRIDASAAISSMLLYVVEFSATSI